MRYFISPILRCKLVMAGIFLLLAGQVVHAGCRPGKDSIVPTPQLLPFIPPGFAILDTASGNLDRDQFPDMVLILKTTGEDTVSLFTVTQYKRPLIILLGHKDGAYTMAGRNDDLVYCYQCGGVYGDPYNGLTTGKGYFTVNHFGGSSDRWLNQVTFKYSITKAGWYLFKIVNQSWSTCDADNVTTEIKTARNFGRIKFSDFKDNEL